MSIEFNKYANSSILLFVSSFTVFIYLFIYVVFNFGIPDWIGNLKEGQ